MRTKIAAIFIILLLGGVCFASTPLRQFTATTVALGPVVDWANGKTCVRDNNDFDVANITCEIIKNSIGSLATLTKTGGDNNFTLTDNGQATLTLTAGNTDSAGALRISVVNKITDEISSEYILPICENFTVYPATIYDAMFSGGALIVDVNSTSQTVIRNGLATANDVNNARDSILSAVSDLNDVSAADVNASIEFYRLDHLLKTGGNIADIISNQSVLAWLLAPSGTVSSYNDPNDSLNAIRTRLNLIPLKPSKPTF